jgi:Rieske Fe-S protein
MAQCETCGNDYERPIEVNVGGQSHIFDSFECAIQKLAPSCEHCGCRIIGHGLQAEGRYFCCAHCASHAGAGGLVDHV